LAAGRDVLAVGGNALDAVTEATVVLEDDPLFNAEKGSVFTAACAQEIDAALMDGRDLRAGAAAGIFGPRNPILAARGDGAIGMRTLALGRGNWSSCPSPTVALPARRISAPVQQSQGSADGLSRFRPKRPG
jgi:L-asparaginase / beta-aspartyl-peptidase